MDICKQLERSHSKENSLSIISYIGNDAERFRELVDCFFMKTPDYRVPQRAAHALSLTFDYQPGLILPYLEKLIRHLREPELRSPLKRNILRILQFVEIPEKDMGNVYGTVLGFLENPGEEIAIRAFSMTVLYNISEKFPELKPEIRMVIESVMEEPKASPGILSKGKNILKKLYKELP